MPSFRYFATIDDSFAILRDLCDRGLRIVAGEQIFERVSDELMMILRSAPSFDLAGAFTPNLQAHVGRVGIIDGKSTLLPGEVTHQSRYRNPKTDQLEPASKELLSAYTLAALTIRNRCTRYSMQIFIAPGAMGLFQRGQVAIDNR
ncbi:MAG TPA: hypothetical protein VF403_02770 [Kofleriaceae bacterium]